MIINAKVQYPMYRFLSTQGEALKIKINIDGCDFEANSYQNNFPLGLLGFGGPLQGGLINVVFNTNSEDRNKGVYEVVGWNNQHDAIKACTIGLLIKSLSEELVDRIPSIENLNFSEKELKQLQQKKYEFEKLLYGDEDFDTAIDDEGDSIDKNDIEEDDF